MQSFSLWETHVVIVKGMVNSMHILRMCKLLEGGGVEERCAFEILWNLRITGDIAKQIIFRKKRPNKESFSPKLIEVQLYVHMEINLCPYL